MKKSDCKSSLCKKNIAFLSYIHSLPVNKRNKVIRTIANKSELNAILELFINFLGNNIDCKHSFIESMKKHSLYFDKLISKSNSIKYKKQLLTNKKGGMILTSLLNLGLPLIKKIFFEINNIQNDSRTVSCT